MPTNNNADFRIQFDFQPVNKARGGWGVGVKSLPILQLQKDHLSVGAAATRRLIPDFDPRTLGLNAQGRARMYAQLAIDKENKAIKVTMAPEGRDGDVTFSFAMYASGFMVVNRPVATKGDNPLPEGIYDQLDDDPTVFVFREES